MPPSAPSIRFGWNLEGTGPNPAFCLDFAFPCGSRLLVRLHWRRRTWIWHRATRSWPRSTYRPAISSEHCRMGSRSWTRSRMPTIAPDSLNSLLIWSNYNTYWNGTLYCLPAPSEYLRSSQHAILNTNLWYYLFSSMFCISLLLNSVHVCVVFHLLMRYIEYQDGFCMV